MSSSLSSQVPCARENQDVYSDVGYGDPTSGPAIVWGRTGRVGDPGVVPEQIDADPLVEDTLKPALNLRTSGEDAGPFDASLWSICCAGRIWGNATKVDGVIPIRTSPPVGSGGKCGARCLAPQNAIGWQKALNS